MPNAHRMLEATAAAPLFDPKKLSDCIEACFDCAQVCVACADGCVAMGEMMSDMRRCVTLDLDCADICETTGRVLSRQTEAPRALVEAMVALCRDACRACAEECDRHASMSGHCRVCAETCRRCVQACETVLT